MDSSFIECPEIACAIELLDTIAAFLKELSQQLSSEQAQVLLS